MEAWCSKASSEWGQFVAPDRAGWLAIVHHVPVLRQTEYIRKDAMQDYMWQTKYSMGMGVSCKSQ